MRVTGDFIKRLDVRFDVYSLKRDWWYLYDNNLLNHMVKINQIGLTHTKDCEEDDRWHQGVGSLMWDGKWGLKEGDFTEVNTELEKLCPYLWKVCNDMKSKFPIGRIRIMIMKPNSSYPMHKDFERRWHLPIISPRNSFYYVRTNETDLLNDDILESSHGIGFHIPENGFVYETENSHWHTAVNVSSDRGKEERDRVHLLFDEAL